MNNFVYSKTASSVMRLSVDVTKPYIHHKNVYVKNGLCEFAFIYRTIRNVYSA